MHDLLEGVVQYEIKLLFGYLTQHFMSEQDLLSRIYGFDYGFLERKKSSYKDYFGECWQWHWFEFYSDIVSCEKHPTVVW